MVEAGKISFSAAAAMISSGVVLIQTGLKDRMAMMRFMVEAVLIFWFLM